MCIDLAGLRGRLEHRVRYLSSAHPNEHIRRQAEKVLAEPRSAEDLRHLWLQLHLFGSVLVIDDVLLDAGLEAAIVAWEGGADVRKN